MVDDALMAITPVEQQGFVTGRNMDRHLLEVWVKQQEEEKGAWVALDFTKAFDSMSHQLIEAMLRVMGVEERWIRAIINFTKGPVGFPVGQAGSAQQEGSSRGTPCHRHYTHWSPPR